MTGGDGKKPKKSKKSRKPGVPGSVADLDSAPVAAADEPAAPPVPVEPAIEPLPVEPLPVEAAPVEPLPVEAAPVEPLPVEAAAEPPPVEAAAEPLPVEPLTMEAAAEPLPIEPPPVEAAAEPPPVDVAPREAAETSAPLRAASEPPAASEPILAEPVASPPERADLGLTASPSLTPLASLTPTAALSEPATSLLAPATEPVAAEPAPPASGDAPDGSEPDRRVGDRRRPERPERVEEPATYTDYEAATLPEPDVVGPIAAVPAAQSADATLDPAAAAFEAARIAGEIVGDIESASGAAIVAAAAAGAAIEAARARRAAGAPPVIAGEAEKHAIEAAIAATDGSTGDPTTTVRMHRERILRALAEDIAGNAAITATDPADAAARALHQARAPSQPGRASSQAGVRGEGEPALDEVGDDDAGDPVQIAAAAIQRLRQRASTDFAELRVHYNRHDIVVIVAAFLIIVVAGRIHHDLVTPPVKRFEQRGLVFEQSQAWLKVEDLPPPAPRIARDPTGQPPKDDTSYHVAFTSSVDPNARIEVLIDKKPPWTNIVTGLELDRRTRWGELYSLDDSSVRQIEDHDWLRTAYRYAHSAEKGDVPRVDHAIEYATVDREQIYVITLFGTEPELERIEAVVAPTLRVATRSGQPLVPQTRSTSRTYPNLVTHAFDSTVMVVVADLIDGKLRARGGGSGVIVGADGSILTNYHVIHDQNGRLHDVFLIGRFSMLDRAPQLQCAGRSNRSKLQPDLDLALIKCDTDLDGRTWIPASAGVWATLPEAKTTDVVIGQRLWVLGYPDVGGGGLTLSEGEIEGWTGRDGAAGQDFIKTDASVTNGNSGGPAVDDQGRLVGIASFSRTTTVSQNGKVVAGSQRGLIRPLSAASDLLAIAAAGWTPREGHTDVQLQPSAVEAPVEGTRIATKVIDAANEAPVSDALVMVLRPGVSASAIDVNRLDDQVLSWGRSNTLGEVQLKQPVPVPGTYTVMVVARGYEPLIGEDKLRLDDKTPPAFDPWGEIKLLAR